MLLHRRANSEVQRSLPPLCGGRLKREVSARPLVGLLVGSAILAFVDCAGVVIPSGLARSMTRGDKWCRRARTSFHRIRLGFVSQGEAEEREMIVRYGSYMSPARVVALLMWAAWSVPQARQCIVWKRSRAGW